MSHQNLLRQDRKHRNIRRFPHRWENPLKAGAFALAHNRAGYYTRKQAVVSGSHWRRRMEEADLEMRRAERLQPLGPSG
jgi:hypothetical protein